MSIETTIVVVAISLIIGGTIGYRYCEGNHARAEVKVLQSDAKVLPTIEAKDAKAKERIVTVIKTIKEEVKPEDCFNQRMSDPVFNKLRDNGIETRPKTDG